MQKLAYLANYFPSMTETFIYREVMELKRRSVSVSVYSLRRPARHEMSEEACPLSESTWYLLPVPMGLLVRSHVSLLLRSPFRYLGAFLKMLAGTHSSWRDRVRTVMHFGEGAVLAAVMAADGITHIHAHYASQSASVARVIHLLTAIPYSFTGHAHDIWHDRLLLPEKLQEAAFAVTCSEFARQWLGREGEVEKIHVVYHGLDVRRFSPSAEEGARSRNLILSVGSLGETKGYPDLLAACAKLRDRNFPFRCVIVGDGQMRGELEELVRSLQLEGTVTLVGAVPQERILQYYRQAWVFALPCVLVEDGRQDGLPNVLMEAMACGVPVITTDTTAKRELIHHGKNGILIRPHQPEELAEAIRELCENSRLREQMVREARQQMERVFDNRLTIEPLLALFDRHVFRGGEPAAR